MCHVPHASLKRARTQPGAPQAARQNAAPLYHVCNLGTLVPARTPDPLEHLLELVHQQGCRAQVQLQVC